jgi:hypothetical protein
MFLIVIMHSPMQHIPTTILFDGQAVLPKEWYPQALLDANDAYVGYANGVRKAAVIEL